MTSYTDNPFYKYNKNLREGIKTEIVYIKSPEKKPTGNVVYIVPTVIMMFMIIGMLFREYRKTL